MHVNFLQASCKDVIQYFSRCLLGEFSTRTDIVLLGFVVQCVAKNGSLHVAMSVMIQELVRKPRGVGIFTSYVGGMFYKCSLPLPIRFFLDIFSAKMHT